VGRKQQKIAASLAKIQPKETKKKNTPLPPHHK